MILYECSFSDIYRWHNLTVLLAANFPPLLPLWSLRIGSGVVLCLYPLGKSTTWLHSLGSIINILWFSVMVCLAKRKNKVWREVIRMNADRNYVGLVKWWLWVHLQNPWFLQQPLIADSIYSTSHIFHHFGLLLNSIIELKVPTEISLWCTLRDIMSCKALLWFIDIIAKWDYELIPSLEDYMIPFCTIKVNPSWSLCVLYLNYMLSSARRDLPMTSGRLPRARVIAYPFRGISWTSLTNIQRGIPHA